MFDKAWPLEQRSGLQQQTVFERAQGKTNGITSDGCRIQLTLEVLGVVGNRVLQAGGQGRLCLVEGGHELPAMQLNNFSFVCQTPPPQASALHVRLAFR